MKETEGERGMEREKREGGEGEERGERERRGEDLIALDRQYPTVV